MPNPSGRLRKGMFATVEFDPVAVPDAVVVPQEAVLRTGQRSPTLDIPMGWIYAAPVIGFALLALRYGLSFFGVIDRFAAAEDPSAQSGEEQI